MDALSELARRHALYAGMEHQAPQQKPFASDRSALLNGLASTLAFVPGVGDLAGLAADADMYATDPGSRNWLNYGLSAAALIPGVPRMPKRKYPMAPEGKWFGEGTYKANGGRIVEMSPDEYISRVRPLEIDEISRENIDLLKKHIEDGGELDPLLIRANGKEDGRHRAYAAKELGIGKVPVIVYDK
jgi:hypothetical protein